MNSDEPTDRGIISNRDMAGKRGRVRNHGVMADMTVMRDVHIGHQKVMIPDGGHTSTRLCPGVQRDVFSKNIMVTDLQPRGFTFKLEILRSLTNRAEGEKMAAGPNRGSPIEHDMRVNTRLRADGHVRADNGVGTNRDPLAEPGPRMHNGR